MPNKGMCELPCLWLLLHEFDDRFKQVPILNVCDRRIGKRRLEKLLGNDDYAGLIKERLSGKETETGRR